jgi:hypothetical protein
MRHPQQRQWDIIPPKNYSGLSTTVFGFGFGFGFGLRFGFGYMFRATCDHPKRNYPEKQNLLEGILP